MNNKKNKNQYCLLDTGLSYIYNLGFHYSTYYECYIYTFPVVSYNRIPTILCRLRLYKLDNIIEFDIIKTDNRPLALYYDREFGNAKNYIRYIDNRVHRKMRAMGIKKKVKKKKGQQNGKSN